MELNEQEQKALNFLNGKRFVITGTLELGTRKQVTDLIESYGGAVTKAVSSLTDYLIVSCSKKVLTAKNNDAVKFDTKIIDEFVFYDAIGLINIEDYVAKENEWGTYDLCIWNNKPKFFKYKREQEY